MNQYKDIAKSVLISTPSDLSLNSDLILNEVLDRVEMNDKDGLVKSRYKEEKATEIKMKRILGDMLDNIAELQTLFDRIQARVLIFQAKMDSIVPYENSVLLEEKIAHSRLISYDTDNHLLTTSKYNVDLSEKILDFLG